MSFFLAEKRGNVELVRLLDREIALGLKTKEEIRKLREVRTRSMLFATVPGSIMDIQLDGDGSLLRIVCANTMIYTYKLRGRKLIDSFSTGTDLPFSMAILGSKAKVIASSGREQRIKFWCPMGRAKRDVLPGSELSIRISADRQSEEMKAPGEDKAPLPVSPETHTKPSRLLAETSVQANPFGILRSGKRSGVLWAAQKTGNLLFLDAGRFVTHSLTKCSGQLRGEG